MKVKDFLRSKPYWLKGGIIAITIVSISFLNFLLSEFINHSSYFSFGIFLISLPYATPFLILMYWFSPVLFGFESKFLQLFHKTHTTTPSKYVKLPEPTLFGWVLSTVVIFIIYFLLGSLFGLILGKKRKNSSKKVENSNSLLKRK